MQAQHPVPPVSSSLVLWLIRAPRFHLPPNHFLCHLLTSHSGPVSAHPGRSLASAPLPPTQASPVTTAAEGHLLSCSPAQQALPRGANSRTDGKRRCAAAQGETIPAFSTEWAATGTLMLSDFSFGMLWWSLTTEKPCGLEENSMMATHVYAHTHTSLSNLFPGKYESPLGPRKDECILMFHFSRLTFHVILTSNTVRIIGRISKLCPSQEGRQLHSGAQRFVSEPWCIFKESLRRNHSWSPVTWHYTWLCWQFPLFLETPGSLNKQWKSFSHSRSFIICNNLESLKSALENNFVSFLNLNIRVANLWGIPFQSLTSKSSCIFQEESPPELHKHTGRVHTDVDGSTIHKSQKVGTTQMSIKHERIHKPHWIYSTHYYPVPETNKILICATVWTNLDAQGETLSDRNQTHKDKYCVIPLTGKTQKMPAHGDKKEAGSCHGWGEGKRRSHSI